MTQIGCRSERIPTVLAVVKNAVAHRIALSRGPVAAWRKKTMAGKPKVFVTRVLPEVGLRQIVEGCDAEIWQDPLPPPNSVLHAKVADCDGLVSLLTDRIDTALLDRAP